MGCLHGVTINIEPACAIANFEVIEIADDSNPYIELLGIDWEFDMNAVINLKNQEMIFEKKSLRVVVPLDRLKERATRNLYAPMRVIKTWIIFKR